jgi:hypothetical protein
LINQLLFLQIFGNFQNYKDTKKINYGLVTEFTAAGVFADIIRVGNYL